MRTRQAMFNTKTRVTVVTTSDARTCFVRSNWQVKNYYNVTPSSKIRLARMFSTPSKTFRKVSVHHDPGDLWLYGYVRRCHER
jgi:hypothetical protein